MLIRSDSVGLRGLERAAEGSIIDQFSSPLFYYLYFQELDYLPSKIITLPILGALESSWKSKWWEIYPRGCAKATVRCRVHRPLEPRHGAAELHHYPLYPAPFSSSLYPPH